MLQVPEMRFHCANGLVVLRMRKWSGRTAHLRTFRGALVAKMRFVGSNASSSLMFLYT